MDGWRRSDVHEGATGCTDAAASNYSGNTCDGYGDGVSSTTTLGYGANILLSNGFYRAVAVHLGAGPSLFVGHRFSLCVYLQKCFGINQGLRFPLGLV